LAFFYALFAAFRVCNLSCANARYNGPLSSWWLMSWPLLLDAPIHLFYTQLLQALKLTVESYQACKGAHEFTNADQSNPGH
jgi:hypothetical protein